MIHNATSVSVPALTPAKLKLDWTHAGTEMRGQHYDMYEIALNRCSKARRGIIAEHGGEGELQEGSRELASQGSADIAETHLK